MTDSSMVVPVDGQIFQQVMASFPAGVAVITTLDREGKPRGLTTTALTSVSLDPPLLLVCVDLGSRTLPALRHTRAFAVNVLDTRHAPLARHFASKVEDKFAEHTWRDGSGGLPILDDHCVAWAECRTRREVVAGDHLVVIGEVLDGAVEGDRASLIYFRRAFGGFAAF
ncbi:MAG: flavin reductase family protein [Solirubrobacteraceae bacterium]